MTTLHYSGESYLAPGYAFTAPGDYEVPEDKAKQLLADFPEQFTAVKINPPSTEQSSTPPAKGPSKDHTKGHA